jgi:signal transduction histidine kinase
MTSTPAPGGTPVGPQAPYLHRVRGWAGAWAPGHWALLDVALAVAAFVGLTVPVLLGVPDDAGNPLAVVPLGAASTLPLAVRRRWPVPVLALVVAAVVAASVLGVRITPWVSNAGPGVPLALYTVVVGAATRTRGLWALGATCVAVVVADSAGMRLHPDVDHDAVQFVAAVAAWWVADNVRAQRAYRAALADYERRDRAERTRLAAAEERLRLSREVHDVVSHSLSVIAVRSGIGRLVAEERPEEARAALAAIETASRGALDELRRLLATTRVTGAGTGAGAVGDGATPADVAPAARLADIPALVERVAAEGLDVTLHQEGAVPAGLSPTLELSAYRIAQEGLTNVVRHAGRAHAVVAVSVGADGVAVEVTDDGGTRAADGSPTAGTTGTTGAAAIGAATAGAVGAATAGAGGGFGLVGVRERAALFGGTVEAGPRPGGGFRLRAWLPAGSPADASDGQVGR